MFPLHAFSRAWRSPARTVPRTLSTSSVKLSEPTTSSSEGAYSMAPLLNLMNNMPSMSQTPSSPSSSPSSRKYHIPKGIHMAPVADPLLTYFSSLIMRSGKRHKAIRQVSETLTTIHRLTDASPLPILRQAVELASPDVKLVTLKRRNKNVPQPRSLTSKQRTGQGLRWIIKASHMRGDFQLEHRLAKEIIAIVQGNSNCLKWKEEQHKLATANRANASVRI
ncbi:ribosomal protein S7 domain-containing protein [Cantharellus anzutake]|uniref:ribosomal protein S7 domain-containing protein n=1 Tax=Cantharellus anzutake TaxID=1750568 RepID=UPI001906DA7D|nr:ribosomal protein S7 domain-containing protein [Cantharellus anzutake]KAF8325869.1 ribosomal protein S7 domain-containing protein [Cantharellus anzutake]